MTTEINVNKADGTYVIRAGGAVLGESSNCLSLSESGYDPVIYFPKIDLAMAFFDQSDKTTTCPHKGATTYYSIQTKSVVIDNAGWSYDDPIAAVSQIKDHIAFDTNLVAVELL